jgi:hypothetical protein
MVVKSARDENIRRRAYDICLERGGKPGPELDDWLKAERARNIRCFGRHRRAFRMPASER